MRKVARLKERFSADLHDELGANLHTIGLLSQLARRKLDTKPEEASSMLQHIDNTTKRTSIAMKNITELQTANSLYTNLENDMQQAAERILVNTAHELHIEGSTLLPGLKSRIQLDLFLFYQECLINISRHSMATTASTRLQIDNKLVTLCVTDNGKGIPESEIPTSLKRRAKLLRGDIIITSTTEGGSCITLIFKHRNWLFILGSKA